MAVSYLNLMVTGDHAVPVEPLGGTAIVSVLSGGPVYYQDSPAVSPQVNQGSITVGNSQSFTNPVWIVSSVLSSVRVELDPAPAGEIVRTGSSNSDPVFYLPPPSGDTTGGTDTANVQAAITALYNAGGGTVKAQPAPPTAPYYTSQIKGRTHVTLEGVGRYATVFRAPLGQAAGLDMCVLNDPVNDYDFTLRSLCLDGNNGSIPLQTWGKQANIFGGINWNGNPGGANDIAKLRPPFYTDTFCKIEDVLVTQIPGRGIVTSGTLVAELRQAVTYWTGLEGIYVGSPDCYLDLCSAAFAGVNPSQFYAGFRTGITPTLTNCSAWWPGITFSYPGGVLTWTVPSGIGFQFDGPGPTAAGCRATDVGIGYLINNGATNALIKGCHAGGARYGIQVGEDFGDIDIHVDNVHGGSGSTPQWAVLDVANKFLANTKLRVSFDPNVTFSTGWFGGNGTDNGAHWVGSDIEIRAGKSQSVAYAAAITPNPFLAPTIKVGTLTGAITINAVVNTTDNTPYPDQELELWLTQDATGGRVVTFNAAYKTTAAIPTTLSTTTVVKFRWDATNAVWREVDRSTA